MARQRRSRRRGSKAREKPMKAGAKVKLHGLPIDIPPELDLPAGAPFEGQAQAAAMQIPKDIKELFEPLVDMATNAWRLKLRMVDPATGEPKEASRKLYRFVEGMFRALGDAGIKVIDKTGKPYDNGMSEKVISFEQTPGLLKDEIIETIRPSIRWKEEPLYFGEIIVGTPVIETAQGDTPNPEACPVSPEDDSDPDHPDEAAESPPPHRDKSLGHVRTEAPGPPESDAVASDGVAVETQDDRGSEQPDTTGLENPPGKQPPSGGANEQATITGHKENRL